MTKKEMNQYLLQRIDSNVYAENIYKDIASVFDKETEAETYDSVMKISDGYHLVAMEVIDIAKKFGVSDDDIRHAIDKGIKASQSEIDRRKAARNAA